MRRALVVSCAAIIAAFVMSPPASAPAASRTALQIDIVGPIGPASVRHLRQGLRRAQNHDAPFVILRIDTPGGLVSSTRAMIGEITKAPMPVIGYVAPSGGHAASAGTFLMYATHINAMAPATNIGAATPVLRRRADIRTVPETAPKKPGTEAEKSRRVGAPFDPFLRDTMTRKITNDMVALIRGLAELRGRNADWGERAVREAATLTATGALNANVVELMAADRKDLLRQLDGRTVTVNGASRVIETTGVVVDAHGTGFLTQIVAIITNPNVALILVMLGIYGIVFEIINFGTVAPGVFGLIALVLGYYGLNQLPLDHAALALLALGVCFMVAEAFVPSFGALGIGGGIAFVIGAALLIETDDPSFQLSWYLIIGCAVVSISFLGLLLGHFWRALRSGDETDADSLVGLAGRVDSWDGLTGFVVVDGKRWRARPATRDVAPFRPEEPIAITAFESETLVVRPLDPDRQPGWLDKTVD